MIKLLSSKDYIEWNNLISHIPAEKRDIYFTPEYYSLYESYGDGEALCFVFEKNGKIALYPFLKNSITKLGYKLDKDYYDIQGAYGYNGLISTTNDLSFIKDFWKSFDEYCQGNDIIAEFMRFHPLLQNHKLGENHFQLIHDRNTVYLNLQLTEDEIFLGFDKSTRKHILKAEKTIEIRSVEYSENNVRIFYDIYYQNMKHVNSTPYLFFNFEHFKNLFRMKNVEFFIAYNNDIPIACYSGLVSEKYYGNYLRASLPEYNRTGVNPLMYWSMIKSAKSHGCHYVHFGGGSNNKPDNSLLKYKMNFSQTLLDFWIGKKIHNQDIYSEVISQWKTNYLESYESHKVMLLGYREI